MLFPKFIIEDGCLILGKCQYHKELAANPLNIKGGGWFKMNSDKNTITFHGESHDYGKASLEDIQNALKNKKVYDSFLAIDDISEDYTFFYESGTEIINLTNPKEND